MPIRSEHRLSIGDAARRCGVATSTLRYYEDRSLVAPTRTAGGRRWYSRDDLRQVVCVLVAQSFGMSLDTIGTALRGDRGVWRDALAGHILELDARVACAVSAKRFLTHAQECPSIRPLRDCPVILGVLDDWIDNGLPVGRAGFAPPRAAEVALGSGTVEPGDPTEAGRLADMRRRYAQGTLAEDDMASDPLEQFRRWLSDAVAAQVPEPNAMVLATADQGGMPSARTVLLKGLDERGFAFYTNIESAKAADLAANPRAAVVFPWHAMERQVRVSGDISSVSRAETAAYFASRPRESQLGAWASAQSSVVPNRKALDHAYAETEARWPADAEIPLPDFWGGYRLVPREYEFWQGRQGRLHDRFRYRMEGDGWIMERLAP
jgi:pyridoxamine 5'-phosphate oxidase